MLFDDNDVQNVALTACKEARGDGIAACVAVMWVIANRGWDWKEPFHSVVYSKNQFTSMSVPTDPEYNWKPEAPADVDIYNQCLAAAPDILNRNSTDPTAHAHYYANLKYVAPDEWLMKHIVNDPTNHPQTAIFGQQTFFL